MTKRLKFTILLFLTIVINSFAQPKPKISFFNEMKSGPLMELFRDSSVVEDLQFLNAEIRMGIMDISTERAEIIRMLTRKGIPVVAWLLLPEEEGYWFHAGNGSQAIARYSEVKRWADSHGIQLSGIGIDLELDYNDIITARNNPWSLLWQLPPRLYSKTEIEDGRKKYAELISMIKADGYMVESYYASFVKDETAAGNTSLQQLTKFLDIKTDREIPMLYSSFIGNADGLLEVYGREAGVKTVALGSTGGGIDTTLNTLTWEELAHDMNMSSRFADEIHIFSLEGAVEKGYLKKMKNFQFNNQVVPDPHQIEEVRDLRRFFTGLSNVLSYPTLLFIGLILIVTGIIFLTIKIFTVLVATLLMIVTRKKNV
jgi:hypothetical protein